MRAYAVSDGQVYVHGGMEFYGQFLFFGRAEHCCLEFGCDGDRGWGVTLAIPHLIYWHASIGDPLPRVWCRREIGVSFHDGAVWWKLWHDPFGEWSRKVPRWRDGNFNFADFFLGRRVCTHRTIEKRDILVPMPERAYAATAELQEWTWKRPRWPAKTIRRVQIDIPDGIPHEGKGENSWDCGVDATYGITTGKCGSIAEGVGELVGSVLASRVKYGGWSDWKWSRPEAKEGAH